MRQLLKHNKILMFCDSYHSYMLSEIEWAESVFDDIFVICPYNKELMEKYENNTKIRIFIYPQKKNIIGMMRCITSVDAGVLKELICTIKKGKFSRVYINKLVSYLFDFWVLKCVIKKNEIKKDIENWVFLSTWFDGAAYSLYRMKKRKTCMKIVSMAHSFEVDDKKSKYVDCLFKKEIHESMDCISFISRKVMDEYMNKYVLSNGWKASNMQVDYLGTKKLFEGVNNKEASNFFHLYSCSHCVPIKRIELIIEALDRIYDMDILWTHIGTGILFEKLKEKANEIKHENIKIEFLGSKDNFFVQKYLKETHIDAIINVSSAEGIPVTLMEASAYNIPIIATDVGGNSEITTNSSGILLGENPSVDDVVKAIKSMAENDNKTFNSYEVFDERFDAKRIRKHFYEMLK